MELLGRPYSKRVRHLGVKHQEPKLRVKPVAKPVVKKAPEEGVDVVEYMVQKL